MCKKIEIKIWQLYLQADYLHNKQSDEMNGINNIDNNNIDNNNIDNNNNGNGDAWMVAPQDPQDAQDFQGHEIATEPPAPEPENRPADNVKACKDIRVIFAHDLSGSMEGSRKMIADGTNEFVQDLQKRYEEPCEFSASFCLLTFSGDRINVGEWTDIHEVRHFKAESFVCNGSTPLWDACGSGIKKIKRDCDGCTAAFYVFTDGDDNNSRNENSGTIRDYVSKLDPTLHTMLFIGSDPLSSVANASAIGATRTKSLNPTSDNTPSAMRACTNAIARCVTGETQTPEFNESDIIMSEGRSVGGGGSAQSYCMIDDDFIDDDNVVPAMRNQTPAISRARSGGGCSTAD